MNVEEVVLNSNINEEEMVVEWTKGKKLYFAVKRFFDILLSGLGIIILSPIFLIVALLIKIDSKGPVFAHKRIGKNGKKINIYKFRTMVENAEELLKTLTKEQEEEYKKNYKLENDFRVTRVGKVLRKLSIDELPQLINIFKGDMSIVGPRPVVDEEIEKYGIYKNKFLSITPGLTGYWQANGRSNTSYEQRIEMELYYVEHCSLWFDIKILFKTVIAVITKDGAK